MNSKHVSIISFVLILLVVSYSLLRQSQTQLVPQLINTQNSNAAHIVSKHNQLVNWFKKTFTSTQKQRAAVIVENTALIPQPKNLLTAHSATLTRLNNGEMLALWFAGSHEGKPDVQIWQSRYSHGKWSIAQAVVSPELITKMAKMYTRKVGNPVVYQATDGKLYLFVVSVALGGWAGSHLDQFVSTDQGHTWHYVTRLHLTPLLNLSTLDRTIPITLANGDFYLPVYHEFIRTYPEILLFNRDGQFVQQIHISSHNDLLQPALLTKNKQLFAYMRNNDKHDNILYYAVSNDAGLTWTKVESTNLTNPDSSIAVASIESDTYVMVHNVNSRAQLSLAISHDGIHWQDIYTLENTAHEEFSYPTMIVHGHRLDVVYTYKRKVIKFYSLSLPFVRFDRL